MIRGKKVVTVMPAYNAAKTLELTFREVPFDFVDEIILVDDASDDNTVEIALNLGIRCFVHTCNMGYGGNQKTCFSKALKHGADIVVVLHPDYQYSPSLIPDLVIPVADGRHDVVIASRLSDGNAIRRGMPVYKYIANRFLTRFQNILLGMSLSEYHSGFRAYSRRVLEILPLYCNSNDFIFDNQILLQAFHFGFSVGEISCQAQYFPDASSIKFWPSVRYGMGVLLNTFQFVAQKKGWASFRLFPTEFQTQDGKLRL